MSYGIIRIEKFKKAAVTGIQRHDERRGKSKSNSEIDTSKSDRNYVIFNAGKTYSKFITERISELPSNKKLRSNINVMLQAVITSDSSFFENLNEAQQKAFFQESFDFVAARYGRENIINATVHLDEKTPHLHINFVPVTKDARLSARDVYTPTECQKLQDDAFEHVFKRFNLQRGVKGSKTKHKTTNELKEITERENALKEQQNAFKEQQNAFKEEYNIAIARLEKYECDLNMFKDNLAKQANKLKIEETELANEKKCINEKNSRLDFLEHLCKFSQTVRNTSGMSVYDNFQNVYLNRKRPLEQRMNSFTRGLQDQENKDFNEREL